MVRGFSSECMGWCRDSLLIPIVTEPCVGVDVVVAISSRLLAQIFALSIVAMFALAQLSLEHDVAGLRQTTHSSRDDVTSLVRACSVSPMRACSSTFAQLIFLEIEKR